MDNKPMIYEAMANILHDVEPVAKEQENKFQKFKFRGIDQVYTAVHQAMARHGVFCTSEVEMLGREERQTKEGGVSVTRLLKMTYIFYARDGSSVSCETIGEGTDTSDKASNKAMAFAHKYALTQTFVVPYSGMDDGDKDHIEHASTAKPNNVADNPDKWRLKLKAVMEEKNITSPEMLSYAKALYPKKNIQDFTEVEFEAIVKRIEEEDAKSPGEKE